MRVADTSAIYAFFDRNDAHHARALRAFTEAQTIIIPAEIFQETMNLLQRREGDAAARAAGEYLWSAENTEVQPSGTDVLMHAWGEFLENRDGLTYPDSIVVAACRELDAEPLTFDKDLLRALRR